MGKHSPVKCRNAVYLGRIGFGVIMPGTEILISHSLESFSEYGNEYREVCDRFLLLKGGTTAHAIALDIFMTHNALSNNSTIR